jgi:hypothetical protein
VKANTCIQLPTSEGENGTKKDEVNEGNPCCPFFPFCHFANLTKTTKIAAAEAVWEKDNGQQYTQWTSEFGSIAIHTVQQPCGPLYKNCSFYPSPQQPF